MQFSFWESSEGNELDDSHGEEDMRAALYLGAEYLVAADLCFAGYRCFLSAAGMSFDLGVEVGGKICRVQVKSTSCAKVRTQGTKRSYVFEPRGAGKIRTGLRAYIGLADIFAFVALDIRRVMYAKVGGVPHRVLIAPSSFSAEACLLSLKTALGDMDGEENGFAAQIDGQALPA